MNKRLTRRQLCLGSVAAATALLPATTLANLAPPKRLRFRHTHTSEKLDIVYTDFGRYLPDALDEINYLLRDFRSGEVHPIEPGLLDLLHALQSEVENDRYFEIISGYRSPATNEALRRKGGGVARRSLHMQGKAIDVRLPGTPTASLRQAALGVRGGGVGYYPKSDFLHLDTGRIRQW